MPGKRIGAICKDGTISKATGRGAGSHHGGVAQWIYADSKPSYTPSYSSGFTTSYSSGSGGCYVSSIGKYKNESSIKK